MFIWSFQHDAFKRAMKLLCNKYELKMLWIKRGLAKGFAFKFLMSVRQFSLLSALNGGDDAWRSLNGKEARVHLGLVSVGVEGSENCSDKLKVIFVIFCALVSRDTTHFPAYISHVERHVYSWIWFFLCQQIIVSSSVHPARGHQIKRAPLKVANFIFERKA